LRVAVDSALDLVFPRDIVYLYPLYAAHGAAPAAIDVEGDAAA
jgi:hypothetical protein